MANSALPFSAKEDSWATEQKLDMRKEGNKD